MICSIQFVIFAHIDCKSNDNHNISISSYWMKFIFVEITAFDINLLSNWNEYCWCVWQIPLNVQYTNIDSLSLQIYVTSNSKYSIFVFYIGTESDNSEKLNWITFSFFPVKYFILSVDGKYHRNDYTFTESRMAKYFYEIIYSNDTHEYLNDNILAIAFKCSGVEHYYHARNKMSRIL